MGPPAARARLVVCVPRAPSHFPFRAFSQSVRQGTARHTVCGGTGTWPMAGGRAYSIDVCVCKWKQKMNTKKFGARPTKHSLPTPRPPTKERTTNALISQGRAGGPI